MKRFGKHIAGVFLVSSAIAFSLLINSCPNPMLDAVKQEVEAYQQGTTEEESTTENDGSTGNAEIPVPKYPSPEDGAISSDTTPLLNWQANSEAAGYHIQINTANDFTGSMIADDNTLTSAAYQVTTPLSNNTTYYWKVRIKNEDDIWGNWSITWSFTIDITLQIPTNPFPSNGSSIMDTTPLLVWEDIEGASGYHIQVNIAENFSGTVIAEENSVLQSEYQISTLLANNTTYYWRVRVKNEDGVFDDWSSTWSFTIDITPPITPNPDNGASITNNTPLLDWEDVTGASDYHVQVNMNSTFTGSVIVDDNSLISSQYQIVSDLSSINITYYWRVKVKNEDGVWGDWSSTWGFTVVPTITTVDSLNDVGYGSAIDLDSSGYPHISYGDLSNYTLKYAKWTGSSWSIEVVDTNLGVVRNTSIALDSSDYPHISYYDDINYDLKYAEWTGSSWLITTVDSTGNVGRYTSIAIDNSDYPHISYIDKSNSYLKYAYKDGSGWHIETPDPSRYLSEGTSIALDGSGYPHISYSSPNGLRHAYKDESEWHIETVDSVNTYWSSIALDTDGHQHIAYCVTTNKDLKYAKWTGSSWELDIVDSVGYQPSIALDSNGYPHITYDGSNYLKYAGWTGSSWKIEIVDNSGPGVGPLGERHIALDSNGYVHISYYDVSFPKHDLKYARFKP